MTSCGAASASVGKGQDLISRGLKRSPGAVNPHLEAAGTSTHLRCRDEFSMQPSARPSLLFCGIEHVPQAPAGPTDIEVGTFGLSGNA